MAGVLVWEKRLLFGSTAATLLAFLFQIVAVGTTSWIHIEFRTTLVQNTSGTDQFLTGYSGGLWRSCEEGYTLDGQGQKVDCKYPPEASSVPTGVWNICKGIENAIPLTFYLNQNTNNLPFVTLTINDDLSRENYVLAFPVTYPLLGFI